MTLGRRHNKLSVKMSCTDAHIGHVGIVFIIKRLFFYGFVIEQPRGYENNSACPLSVSECSIPFLTHISFFHIVFFSLSISVQSSE